MRSAGPSSFGSTPNRSAFPYDRWAKLFAGAAREIGILVYAGMFLLDVPGIRATISDVAEAGTRVRIMVGNPTSRGVMRRSEDEGIGRGAIPAKARNALAFYRPLADVPNVGIRVHGTTLYNSIYWFDDEMIVNTHVYGQGAAYSPVLHVRRLAGGALFDNYVQSFDRVWNTATAPKW